MQHITIGRFEADPSVQGVVEPNDKSWQLVIDAEGIPHLYILCQSEDENGAPVKGLICLEDFLVDKLSIKDLMQGTFAEKLSLEEEKQAYDEWVKDREERQIPCPRNLHS